MCHGGIKEIKKQTKMICEEEEEEEIMSGGSVGPLLIPANYVGCLSANQMTGTFLLSPLPAQHHTPVPLLPPHIHQHTVHCTKVVAPTLHCWTSEYRHAGPELRKPSEKVLRICIQSICAEEICRMLLLVLSSFGFSLHKLESFLNSGE